MTGRQVELEEMFKGIRFHLVDKSEFLVPLSDSFRRRRPSRALQARLVRLRSRPGVTQKLEKSLEILKK